MEYFWGNFRKHVTKLSKKFGKFRKNFEENFQSTYVNVKKF